MRLDSLGQSNQEFFSISSGHLLKECNGKYMGLYLSTQDEVTTLSIGKCDNVASPGMTSKSGKSKRRRRDSEEYNYYWTIYELGVVEINLDTWENRITIQQSEMFIQIEINGHVHLFPLDMPENLHFVDLWAIDELFDDAIEISEPADGEISDLTVSSGNSMDKCNGKFYIRRWWKCAAPVFRKYLVS